jgi:hypothetical protein
VFTLAGSLVAVLAELCGGQFVIKRVNWTALVVLVCGLPADSAGGGHLTTTGTTNCRTTAVANPVSFRNRKNRGATGWVSRLAVLLSDRTGSVTVLFALMLLLAPFGERSDQWFRQTARLAKRPEHQAGASAGRFVATGAARLALSLLAVKMRLATPLPAHRNGPGHAKALPPPCWATSAMCCAVSLALSAVGIGAHCVGVVRCRWALVSACRRWCKLVSGLILRNDGR